MEPPIQQNPYAPPTFPVSFDAQERQRYVFETEVLESDVHRACRRLSRFFVWFSFLSLGLLSSVLLVLGSARSSNLQMLFFFAPASLLLFVLMVRTTWLNLGPGAGRRRVRATPLMIGHIHGTITDSEIRIDTDQSSSIHPLKSCGYAEVHADSLVFAFDQRRLMLHVIPRRAFAAGDFERAARLLVQSALANKSSPANGVVDERLQGDQFYPVELPASGVSFSGPITSQDVLASPLRSQAMKVKWSLIGTSVLMTLFPIYIVILTRDKIRLEFGVLLFVFFLFLNFRLWSALRKHMKWTHSPEQILMKSQGVLGPQALHASTPIGATIYQWDIFTEATLQEELISLALPGKLGHLALLARRQFASDSDWSKAKEIIFASVKQASQ